MSNFKRNRILFAVYFVFVGIFIGLSIRFNARQLVLAEKSPVPTDACQELNKISDSLAQVASAVPSVDNFSTTRLMRPQSTPANDLFNNPSFRKFFGDRFSPRPPNRQLPTSSLGSGVIVSGNRHVLTSNHIIENAEIIVITLRNVIGGIKAG
ncbi:MAG: hypothetical protein KQH63_20050 [Desulfobulbaceae bacterium]|nr:hypothetical protein [Desulfobulbaceae bacterium]